MRQGFLVAAEGFLDRTEIHLNVGSLRREFGGFDKRFMRPRDVAFPSVDDAEKKMRLRVLPVEPKALPEFRFGLFHAAEPVVGGSEELMRLGILRGFDDGLRKVLKRALVVFPIVKPHPQRDILRRLRFHNAVPIGGLPDNLLPRRERNGGKQREQQRENQCPFPISRSHGATARSASPR